MMRRWAFVVFLFALATVAQVIFYGGPPIIRFFLQRYLPFNLFFFGGFEICAGLLSWKILRTDKITLLPAEKIAILIVLSLIFTYLGGFISFNTWGT